MNAVASTRFPVKPLVAALAIAFAAGGAYADPTPNQLPGAGLIRAVGTGTSISITNNAWLTSGKGVAGDQIYNGTLAAGFFPGSIQLESTSNVARAVIRWGGNGASLETYNPQGFNIGTNAAVYFTSGGNVSNASVLNIDASGNPSQIFGKLVATSDVTLGTGVPVPGVGGGAAPVVFVSNANGIIVGSTGYLQLPSGGGLIGANMNNDTAMYDFVANNGAGTTGFLDITTGQSKVVVNGTIDGGMAVSGGGGGMIPNGVGPAGVNSNIPAAYVLLVGGDIVNTGNIFAANVFIDAGMRAYSSATASDTINGISKVSVQRLFSVDAGAYVAGPDECTSSATCVEVARTGSTFVNTGSISSTANFMPPVPPDVVNVGPLGGKSAYGFIDIMAAKGIRSGTRGDTSKLIGLFADADIRTNVYEAGGLTEFYNAVDRYSIAPGLYIGSFEVNQATGWDGDVIVEALTRNSTLSSITTNYDVDIRGVNVTVNSTINHQLNPDNGYDTNIVSTNSMVISKDIGAGGFVNLTNTGAGGINISGNVLSDLDNGGYGGVVVSNTGSNAPTTISGNVTARGYSTGDLDIDVNGPLNITGALASYSFDVNITNNKAGATTIINNPPPAAAVGASNVLAVGTINASENVNITTHGNTDINSAIVGDFVSIYNDAIPGSTTTTIAGSVLGFAGIDIHNNAGTSSNLNIDASLRTGFGGPRVGSTATASPMESEINFGDIHVFSHGNLRLSEATAVGSVYVDVDGLKVFLTGPITANAFGGETLVGGSAPAIQSSGIVDINAVNANTRVATNAVITAPEVYLEVLNFKGVRNDGTDYTATSQKPAFQIAADLVVLTAYGSVNAPLTAAANPTNDWLKNSMWLASLTPGAQVQLSVSALGAGFQAINLGVAGDLAIDSGLTTTPFYLTGYASPVLVPPVPQGNVGSSLIVQATGNIDIYPGTPIVVPPIVVPPPVGNVVDAALPTPTPLSQFLFPGGVVFKAGGYLAINTPINNAWSFNPAPYQGQWFEAKTIIDSGYHATNAGSWINYSSYPVTGPGTAYSIAQPAPGLFQFVNTPEATHYNVYSTAILGGTLCNVPNPPAPWPPSGC